jgi:hypothetical protein
MEHEKNALKAEGQEELRKKLSRAIGTYENQMVYNISKECAEIAYKHFDQIQHENIKKSTN